MEIPDLASVDIALTTTRSVRRRIDWERPVPPDVIERCIDIATQAPTGLNLEAWRFLVLSDPARKLAMAELYRKSFERMAEARADYARQTGTQPPALRKVHRDLAERLHEMPALILVCMQGRPDDTLAQQVGFYGSILPAAWSLMVALRARGLGSTWTSLHLIHEREAAKLLGIPDDVTQTVLLPVGYMRDAVLAPAPRKGAREVTYWNQWGAARPS
ncbi:MAG: nitroreductase family protein [Myxococcota bacterium]|nr:nitroreductase family protein [Myxococcota bacterium]